MKPLTCAATRRRLDAFHDRELSIADQIAVDAHLDWCDECAALSDGLRMVGTALRASVRIHTAASSDDVAGFGALVLNRWNAERGVSWVARVRGVFEDWRVVYAGVSATVAATVCLLVMVGMMRFATESRPDSLAAILGAMAAPFECDAMGEVQDGLGCRARWLERFERAQAAAELDAVFTLDAIIIHDGRLANLAVLRASRYDALGQAEVVEELLDSVYRARSAPELTGLPGSMLRIVAKETVRASGTVPTDLQLPPTRQPAPAKAAAHRVVA